MAGTVTMVSIPSSSMACRNAPTSKTGMLTEAAQAARHPGGAVPQRAVAQPRAAAGLHHGLGRALPVDGRAEHVHQVAGQALVALDAIRAAGDPGQVEDAAQVTVIGHEAPPF